MSAATQLQPIKLRDHQAEAWDRFRHHDGVTEIESQSFKKFLSRRNA